MEKKLRILILDDVQADAELVEHALRKARVAYIARHVVSRGAFLKQIKEFSPDIILSDYAMPEFDGMAALRLTQEQLPGTPFIIVTGSMNEETVVECMKAGANDYVTKQHLAHLGPAVKAALEKQRLRLEKEHADANLRESEERYRNLVENISDVFYVSDAQGKLVYGSPNLFTGTGYSSQDILGKSYLRLIAPDDRRRVADYYLEQLKTGARDAKCEFRALQKDGSIAWVEQMTRIVRDTDGNVSEYRNVVRDITERKRAEQQMRQLSMAVEQTADSVVITDREGVIQYVNAAFEKETGYTREEALGKTPRILKSGVHHPRFYENLWKTILAGNVFKAVFINRNKAGELFYEQKTITPLKDSKGNTTHFVSTAKNITDQMQAEKTLRESEERYRDLFESTSDLIQAVAPDGRLLYANRAWREVLGYTEEELIGLNIDRVMHPKALTQCFETLQRAMSGEKVDRIETRFVTKDGKAIIAEGSVACRFEASQPVAVTCFLRDITERREAEETLRRKEDHHKAVIESIFKFIPEGVLVLTESQNLLKHNKAFDDIVQKYAPLLGYTEQELAEKIVEQLRSKILSGDTTEICIPKKSE